MNTSGPTGWSRYSSDVTAPNWPPPPRSAHQLLRRVREDLAEHVQPVLRGLARIERDRHEHLGADGMEPVLERRDCAELAAAAAQRPSAAPARSRRPRGTRAARPSRTRPDRT